MNPKPDESAWQDALEMVDFAVKVCRMQAKAGRYFLFEHPLCATSWKLTSLAKLKKEVGVMGAVSDMCAFGMKAADQWGEAYAKKPTRFLTNSKAIMEKVSNRCPGDHRHVPLVGGRANAAAEYPDKLIDAILDGYEIESANKIFNIQESYSHSQFHIHLI